MCNLRPLNLPYALLSTYLSLLAFNASPSLRIHGTGKRQLATGYVDMLWCQGAQNIGLSNRKLKSAQKCAV